MKRGRRVTRKEEKEQGGGGRRCSLVEVATEEKSTWKYPDEVIDLDLRDGRDKFEQNSDPVHSYGGRGIGEEEQRSGSRLRREETFPTW